MVSDIRKACLVCGSTDLKTLRGDYARAHLKACRTCGFVFSELEPDDEELFRHYAHYDRTCSISWVTEKRYGEILAGFEPYRTSGRIFDMGCGAGHFLQVARNLGWDAFGSEFDEPARDACRSKGVTVFPPDRDLSEFYGTFDVVTSFEVLEHLKKPGDSVRLAFDLLRPGGVFYFTTPNFDAISRRLLGASWNVIDFPEHLCYFTPKTVDRLIRPYGFEKKFIRTSGVTIARNLISLKKGEVADKDGLQFQESLREKAETRKLYGLAKRTVNFLLNTTGTGDSMTGFYVKKS